jgi:phage antirepressor YoqD-like protein
MSLAIIQATMTSREIADLVNSNHADVRRSIERLADRGVITLPPLAEVPNDGFGPKTISVYLIGKRDSYVIVAQLSPEFTARLVDRWQELEAAQPTPAFNIPQTYSAALRLCADQSEQIEQQAAQLAIAAPAVAFVDRFVNAEGLKGFREVAKAIKANEAQFREFLIDKKIMYRLAGKLTGYQPHIDAGRFEVRAGIARHNERAFTETKFTAKGLNWIAGEWAKHCLIAQTEEA